MKKTKPPPKEIPQCDQDLIISYMENSVKWIIPLIEGQFLSDIETSFMVDGELYSLKLEKKPKPKVYARKSIITLSVILCITFGIIFFCNPITRKAPYSFQALFGFMSSATAIYVIDMLAYYFQIPFLIKVRPQWKH